MSDQQAKAYVDEIGDSMGLSPIERLAVRLVAKHETQNGDGWDAQGNPPRAELGAGSNNMGAIITTSTTPGTFFVHSDSRFDPKTGKVVEYSTKFSRNATPQAGFRELARVLLFNGARRRDNVAAALANGSIFELASAMRMNRYFLGTKPIAEAIDDYAQALTVAYEQIKARTGEDFFDGPKAGPGSPEVSGSGQGSPSSQSARQYLQRLSSSLPVLRHGARGDVVGVLQFELGCDPDGRFGPKTEAALRLFQQYHGIETDIAPSGKPLPQGQCGVKTWAALFDVPTHDQSEELAYDDANRVGGDRDPLERLQLRTPEQQAELERIWTDDDDTTIA